MAPGNIIDGALVAIEELRIDTKIGKSKHFFASDRKMIWHRVFGVPVIIANLFIGIVLVNFQGTHVPQIDPNLATSTQRSTKSTHIVAPPLPKHVTPWLTDEWISVLTIFLTFGAASLSGIQTFFNFHKASEGHRSIGNRYLHVSRQCKGIQQKHRDIPFGPESIWAEYEKLYSEYNQINTEAESFPTNPSDLKKARAAPEISPYTNPHAPQI